MPSFRPRDYLSADPRDKSYDSKAILGVAYQYATGRVLGPDDFSGGVHGAASVLRASGFEIVNTRDRTQSDSRVQ